MDSVIELKHLLDQQIVVETAKASAERVGATDYTWTDRAFTARSIVEHEGTFYAATSDISAGGKAAPGTSGSAGEWNEFQISIAIRGLGDPVRTAGRVTGPDNDVLRQYSTSGHSAILEQDNFITLSVVDGGDEYAMDGYAGLTKQVVRVSPFSAYSLTMLDMAAAVRAAFDDGNFRGTARANGAYISLLHLDMQVDIMEEESTIFGRDQYWKVALSQS